MRQFKRSAWPATMLQALQICSWVPAPEMLLAECSRPPELPSNPLLCAAGAPIMHQFERFACSATAAVSSDLLLGACTLRCCCRMISPSGIASNPLLCAVGAMIIRKFERSAWPATMLRALRCSILRLIQWRTSVRSPHLENLSR